jgi:tetratricopeptide (TPR) repeat protein
MMGTIRIACLLWVLACVGLTSASETNELKESRAPKSEAPKAEPAKIETPKAEAASEGQEPTKNDAIEQAKAALLQAAKLDAANDVRKASLAAAKGAIDPKEPGAATLELIRTLRFQKSFEVAEKQARELLTEENPPEIRRLAMLELAYIAIDSQELAHGQEILSEYLRRYPKDASVPEVCLRQGLLFRQMGAHQQALARFYQVMNYALTLKLDRFDYYQTMVLKAKTEIAETYYLQGKYAEAADYFTRLLKAEEKGLDRPVCQFKLIKSLSAQEAHDKVVAQAQSFVELYSDSLDVPEVRFMLADSLKKLGRNRESMQQVLVLLQSQQKQAQAHPEIWVYWQQRTGNEIANELYKEGDYMSALEIYLGLAKVSNAPNWQAPVWYQIGLVYEHLKQPAKAAEYYDLIMKRQEEIRTGSPTPAILALLDMAKWRQGYLNWGENADSALRKLSLPAPTSSVGEKPAETKLN